MYFICCSQDGAWGKALHTHFPCLPGMLECGFGFLSGLKRVGL